jgi:TolA-binding protein
MERASIIQVLIYQYLTGNQDMSAKGKLWVSIAIGSLLASGITSCTTPANVRHGNREAYLVEKTLPKEEMVAAEKETHLQIEDAQQLDFSEDLKSIKENTMADQVPQISKTEADEIAALTKELFNRNPSSDIKSNGDEIPAGEYDFEHKEKTITGLPTLQNQIDAIRETYIAQDEKLEDVVSEVAHVKTEVSDIKKDISKLQKEVIALSESKSSPIHNKITNTNSNSKKVKGYKLLSDEELEEKKQQTNEKVSETIKEDSEVEDIPAGGRKDGNIELLKKSMSYKVAMNAISRKDYKNATIQLNRLKNEFPTGAAAGEIDYWIGESSYGLKQYKKALTSFRNSANIDSDRADDASAMIAECMIKLGRVKEAKQEYKDFIAQYPSSNLVPRARKMLQQL